MSVVILVFFAIPSLFGFQNFVQWGAMYDNRWCTVVGYENNPYTASEAPRSEVLVPGSEVSRVYSGASSNRQACMAQARMRCGRQSKDGWTVTWVEPEFQHVRYMGKVNICDRDLPSLDYWFFDEK